MLRRLSNNHKRTIAHWVMEFVVVVAGVLLALWLQERVSEANDDQRMRAAEAAIRSELDDNLMILIAHTAVDRCLSDRLLEVEDRIRSGSHAAPITGHPLMLPRVGKAPMTSKKVDLVYVFFDVRVQDTAWNSAIASGALSRMDRKRFNELGSIYSEYRMIDSALASDIDAGSTLQVLAYGTDLTPDLRARLIGALNLASRNRQFLSHATTPSYVAGQMRDLGWNDETAINSRIDDFIKSMHGFGFYLRPCARSFANPFSAATTH